MGSPISRQFERGRVARERIELYKLRNTAHLKGRHSMAIGPAGVTVFPRYDLEANFAEPAPSILTSKRLPSGVAGLDELVGGGFLERSVTLVSGSAGIGKSTLAFQFLVAGAERNEPGLYVALEEGPEQIIETAGALGIPVEATRKGLIEVAFVSRDRIRPSQLLSLLTDKIRAQKSRRLVLDSVSHLASEGMSDEELRQLVYALISRFKTLGVTTLLTLESAEMHPTGRVTDRRFSPLADNLIMLRYAPQERGLRPVLTVVKTRGSGHDFGTHAISIGPGGLRVGLDVSGPPRSRSST